MTFLIDAATQDQLASRIDNAVKQVLAEIDNHGSEEGLTPVLGHALRGQSFQSARAEVIFNYRQTNKRTEERPSGADGGFLVSVTTDSAHTKKAALFQAKLLRGDAPVRQLGLNAGEATRLKSQVDAMLGHTQDSVALFYTREQVYVVDAHDYQVRSVDQVKSPSNTRHRLLTLGTYLGKWLPRCSKGDTSSDLVTRVEHLDGFKHGLDLSVILGRPKIAAARPRR